MHIFNVVEKYLRFETKFSSLLLHIQLTVFEGTFDPKRIKVNTVHVFSVQVTSVRIKISVDVAVFYLWYCVDLTSLK